MADNKAAFKSTSSYKSLSSEHAKLIVRRLLSEPCWHSPTASELTVGIDARSAVLEKASATIARAGAVVARAVDLASVFDGDKLGNDYRWPVLIGLFSGLRADNG
jgi:hypothetical protein